MDRYRIQSSEILSALSFSDKKMIGQFQSLIPLTGSSFHHTLGHGVNCFQHSPPIPNTILHEEQKNTSINGFNLHLISNDKLVNTTSLSGLGGNMESSSSPPGIQTSCIDYQRPRSHSMGLAVTTAIFQTSRSHSRDSLASCSSLLDECQVSGKDRNSEEALVEVTCNKFKRLSTGVRDSPQSHSPVNQILEAKSASRSPPLFDVEVGRKYSFGSHMLSSKRQLSRNDCPPSPHGLPIDLTCKRVKPNATSNSLGALSGDDFKGDPAGETNFDLKDHSNEDQSILKSVLVGTGGRKRSYTLSVCSRQHFRNNGRETPMGGLSLKQRVTLAKRNVGPVMGRMSEHVNRITQFLSSQPDFLKLSLSDQKSLITDSVHRLLMLYVAEGNLQFVVTPVRDDEDTRLTENGTIAEEPTVQFTETVQNFISKCQVMNISSSEYALMRVMSLFHAGSKLLENLSEVEKSNAEAQQNLQGLVQRCYPNDRLRYSKLLLSLYTLFGINSSMLEALFCRHLIPNGNGGLAQFILTDFLASKGPNEC